MSDPHLFRIIGERWNREEYFVTFFLSVRLSLDLSSGLSPDRITSSPVDASPTTTSESEGVGLLEGGPTSTSVGWFAPEGTT